MLLHLYADRGASMVHALRGMFAFAIWDSEKDGLLIARDGYGIKPLYYSDDGKTFRFASQVKALMAGGKLSKVASPAGWVGFYLFGSVPEPHTTYASVRALPAGATLWIDTAGAADPRHYFSVAAIYCDAEIEPAQLDDRAFDELVRGALLDSVRHHLIADVPVGSFLSAGIDSSALVGLMRETGGQDVQTITVAFEEFRGTPHDESVLAEKVAAQYGTRHTTRLVTEREFHDDLPKILAAMDQPTIDGINTWFVSKAAREQGLKVAISGLGGDELFGGYPSFSALPRLKRVLGAAAWVPGGGPAFARLVGMLNRCGMPMHPKTAALLNLGHEFASVYLLLRGLFMPDELGEVLDASLVAEGLRALRPHELIETALSPEPKSAFAKVATLESSLVHAQSTLARHRLGEHGAFARSACAAGRHSTAAFFGARSGGAKPTRIQAGACPQSETTLAGSDRRAPQDRLCNARRDLDSTRCEIAIVDAPAAADRAFLSMGETMGLRGAAPN